MPVETEIALLKKDMESMHGLFNRLDTAIEKMSEVSGSINQMLAVHEERLIQIETIGAQVRQEINTERDQVDNDIKELHSRITTQGRELQKDMKDDIEKVLESIKDLKEHVVKSNDRLETRISALEKWRWIIFGAIVVAAALIPDLGIGNFLK